MKTNIQQPIIAGLINNSIEIFRTGYNLFFVHKGNCKTYTQSPEFIRNKIRDMIYTNLQAMRMLYKWCNGNAEAMEIQYCHCNFGGLDFKPDYDHNTGTFNREIWDCHKRGICEGEGIICLPSPTSSLTPKEKEVSALITKGLPKKLIADSLKISPNTVNQHCKSIYRKLGATNKTEAALSCMGVLY